MHSKLYVRLLNAKEWRVLRGEWLTDHPLCESCKQRGIVTAAREIHHITPIESARTDEEATHLAYSKTNLMSLCHQCHREIHDAEHSHSKAAHKKRVDERLERWINKHKPKTNNNQQ